jgi:hypothetical protein
MVAGWVVQAALVAKSDGQTDHQVEQAEDYDDRPGGA